MNDLIEQFPPPCCTKCLKAQQATADEIERLINELRDVTAKLNFLLAWTPTDENLMTFPDGDIWPASQALANKQGESDE